MESYNISVGGVQGINSASIDIFSYIYILQLFVLYFYDKKFFYSNTVF